VGVLDAGVAQELTDELVAISKMLHRLIKTKKTERQL